MSATPILSQRSLLTPPADIPVMMKYGRRFPDAISLGQGTPQFPTPAFIWDSVREHARTDPTIGMYLSPTYEQELLRLVADRMEQQYGFRPSPTEELAATIGGAGGLFATMNTILDPGDEVIYFTPSYPMHLSQILLTGGSVKLCSYDASRSWRPDLSSLEQTITPKTKIVVITNPNNPTGTVWTKEEIEKLSEIIIHHSLYLLVDEAYDYLTYDGRTHQSPLSVPGMRERTIISKSFSKEYAMTGWRIGYILAPPELMPGIRNTQVNFAISPPTPSVAGAIAAISDPRGEDAKRTYRDIITESRNVICERASRLPHLFRFAIPEGSFYLFPEYLGFSAMDATTFTKLLIDEAHVITIPGTSSGPGGNGHIRMSFAANPETIHSAFDRIEVFAKNHHLS